MAGIDDATSSGLGYGSYKPPTFSAPPPVAEWNPLAEFNLDPKTAEQAKALHDGLWRTRVIWLDRFNANKPPEGSSAGKKITSLDDPLVEFDATSPTKFSIGGVPLTPAQIQAIEDGKFVYGGSGGDGKDPAMYAMAVDALNQIDNRLGLLKNVEFPSDGTEAAAKAAEKKALQDAEKKSKPVDVGLAQFMNAISGQESGGQYDATNGDSGAYGRFQIMPDNWPSWSAEAGIPGEPPTPENQDYVAAFKMQQYFNSTGSWADVASIWYSGQTVEQNKQRGTYYNKQYSGDNEYPSIEEYVNSIMGKLADVGTAIRDGVPAPDGTLITGNPTNSGSRSSGSTFDPLKAKQDAEDRAWTLQGRGITVEQTKADEVDRQRDAIAKQAKDYLTMLGQENDLSGDQVNLLKSLAGLKTASQSMNDDAIATSAKVNEMANKGSLDYYDRMAGPIWSDPLASLYKQMEAVEMKQAPDGLTDMFLHDIPKNIPYFYDINQTLGLPPRNTERWANGTVHRYAEGTSWQNYPGLTWHDEANLANYLAGRAVPSAFRAKMEQASAQTGGSGGSGGSATTGNTDTVPVVQPDGSIQSYKPGYVPFNATVPSVLRVYDTNDWLDAGGETLARMVTAGSLNAPPSWGLGDLSGWAGVPAAAMPASLLNRLRGVVSQFGSTPEGVALFGPDPQVATKWIPDPNAEDGRKVAVPGGQATRTSGTGFSGNPGGGTTYTGSYGANTNPGDPDLDKKLGWEREQFNWQKEMQQAQLDLEKIKDTRSAEYQAAQIRWGEADMGLKQAQHELQIIDSGLRQRAFDEELRQAQWNEMITGEKLDMDKVRQAADLRYQEFDMDLKTKAGALDQAQFDESKRQFDETFAYQKAQDDKKNQLERAEKVARFMADPNDPMARNFFYGNMAEPEGEAYDMFTGESTGRKTYSQTVKEDAKLYKDSQKVPLLALGDDSYVTDFLAIVGDSTPNRATGNEELVLNPTGAPIAIVNNKLSQQTGLVPKKGKPFGNNVKMGR